VQKTWQIESGRLVEAAAGPEAPCPILFFLKPDEAERRRLVDEHQIDEHTLNSALDPDELSRLEFEPNHVALIFKQPQNYSGRHRLQFKVASTGVFLFKDRLIIVQSEDLPLFEDKQFSKVCSLPHVMLRMVYRSIFHFLEHLKVINRISDELERKINAAMENRYLLDMFTLEKSLVYYVNSINSNQALVEKMKNSAAKIGFSPEELEFLDDIIIENNQCCKQAEIYSNILASLMDARASIVSNNLNVLMKTLNIITIGIMVPTFVVSAFSMNVGIPFQKHPLAFWIIIGLAVASEVGLILFWRKKRW
jgi:magnesium transporter